MENFSFQAGDAFSFQSQVGMEESCHTRALLVRLYDAAPSALRCLQLYAGINFVDEVQALATPAESPCEYKLKLTDESPCASLSVVDAVFGRPSAANVPTVWKLYAKFLRKPFKALLTAAGHAVGDFIPE
jgi:hypothetical protein